MSRRRLALLGSPTLTPFTDVVEHLNDRLPPRVGGRPAKNAALLGTGELGELILNGECCGCVFERCAELVSGL